MTIQEVARRAGVSKATVSRVLNQPQLVKPATRERVMAVISELGFTVNPFAQGLNAGRGYSIALVVGNLTNPYYAQVAEGCDQELRQAGYQMVIANTYQNPSLEADAVDGLVKRRISGLINAGLMDPTTLVRCAEAGVPLAVIGRSPPSPVVYDSIVMDDVDGMWQTARHLYARGYREIACITGAPDHPITRRRFAALQEAVAGSNLVLPPEWVVPGEFHSMQSGLTAMRRLLAGPARPRAVVAMNDILAIGALRGAHEAELAVPGEVAVVGFDDIPLASYSWPPLTTIHSNNLEMGRKAARCILERIRQPDAPPHHIVVPAELIVRASS